MGEATHGTSEFFKMKHRMFEFLVEEMGYRVFAIEGDFGAGQVINDYVINGKGSAKDALATMKMWQWDTEEVIAMIEWMRKYNEDSNHKEKVKFYGFDMQKPHEDLSNLFKFLGKVDENTSKEFKDKFNKFEKNSIWSLKVEDFNNIETHIEELKSIFKRNKEDFVKKTSVDEYELAIQHLAVLGQGINYYKIFTRDGFALMDDTSNFRDQVMADNVRWIFEYERKFGNDKIMLWAHNLHVSKAYLSKTSMGELLSKTYNDKYYAVGFQFYSGSFNARSIDSNGKIIGNYPTKFTIKGENPREFLSTFEKTGIPLGFIDFMSASQNKKINELFIKEQTMHSIGNDYSGVEEESYLVETPIRSYDGLIFIKDITSVSELER